jgi:protein-S-isoprenylcysteine O-methyltransferase Ste14
MSPLAASATLIGLWAFSWLVAAVWQRRTSARPPLLDQLAYIAPAGLGGVLLFSSLRARAVATYDLVGDDALWRTPSLVGWLLFGLCAVGLAFTWWARLTLGDLWSSTVQRKEHHAIVERGPYRLVRHPIYTGLIGAFVSIALQLASPAGFAGVAFIVLGFFIKARLEERFLGEALGSDYAAYRARTPMLTPFWPVRR